MIIRVSKTRYSNVIIRFELRKKFHKTKELELYLQDNFTKLKIEFCNPWFDEFNSQFMCNYKY